MRGTAIARLSSQGIQRLLSSPLALEGGPGKVKLPPVTHPAETLPRHAPESQTWEHPTGHTGSKRRPRASHDLVARFRMKSTL